VAEEDLEVKEEAKWTLSLTQPYKTDL